jgi:4-amino-4-deoxy-L-arabinose transferase-like glycosyltransferase
MTLRRITIQFAPQLLAGAFLAMMAVTLLTIAANKSITIDETLIIPAGYYYLGSGNFQIAHDHPPLAAISAGLPMLFLPVQVPSIVDLYNQNSTQHTLPAGERFWSANREHFRAIFFWSRVPIILMTVLLGIVIFMFADRLFGKRAGLLAVILFSFEPTILAHGRIVKDIDVALAYLLFCFALYLYGTAPTLKRTIFLGLACGFALSVKYSMLIVLPILLLFAAFMLLQQRNRVRRKRIVLQTMGAFVLALIVLNAAYLFQHQPLLPADVAEITQNSPAHATRILSAIKFGSLFVPPYFLKGALVTLQHNDAGHPAFLLGNYSDHGWWYYFPVAFSLKTTIPFLLVSVASILWALWRVSRRESKFLVVLVPMLVYAVLTMFAAINIGIRHLLPAFPFLFILSGAFLDRILNTTRPRKLGWVSVIVVLALCVFEALRVYPNYIPYMNQVASRRPHWTYLSDSNVEWGDDASGVATYLKARGETRVRAAFLGGSMTLPLYGVEYIDLLGSPEVKLEDTRYVAIGASFLNGSTVPSWSEGSGRETPELRHNYFARYREREPEAVIGNSIYLFRER